jgi:hypothetical protein
MKKQKIIAILADHGFSEGRCIAWSKTGYSKSHQKHFIIFNAQIFSRRGRILRQVDLDLTVDSPKLTAAARAIGGNLYVLHEHRPRVECSPKSGPIIPVLRDAVWWTRIRPGDQDVFRLMETSSLRLRLASLACITGSWQGQPAYAVDVWLNPEWDNLHMAGSVIELCGRPPEQLRVVERLTEKDEFTIEPCRTRGRPIRPVFRQQSGLLDFVWFNSGAAVPSVLYDNTVGLLNNLTFTCHAGCEAIHARRNRKVIGLIWPSRIFAQDVVSSAQSQLNAITVASLDPTEGKTGKDFVTRAELLKLHKRVLERVRKMTQEEGFRSLAASGIYTAEGKLAKEYGG